MNKAMSLYEVAHFEDPPPPPRPAARVYLPSDECGVSRKDEAAAWSTVEVTDPKTKKKRIEYIAATDLHAPVPSVAGGGGVYDCDRPPPPPPAAPVETNPDGTPITVPGAEPGPPPPDDSSPPPGDEPAPPPDDGTPPSSEDAGGGDG